MTNNTYIDRLDCEWVVDGDCVRLSDMHLGPNLTKDDIIALAKLMGIPTLSPDAMQSLILWIHSRADDIRIGMEDLGGLKSVLDELYPEVKEKEE